MGVFWSKSTPAASDSAAQRQQQQQQHVLPAQPIEREPSPSRLGDALALDAAQGGGGYGSTWQTNQQAVWVPDNSSNECMLCKRGFGWFTRKHHCRQCGSLVCSQCSPHRALARGFLTSQRVCTGCMGAMALAEQSALNSRRHSFSQQQQQLQKQKHSRRNSPSRLVADRHAEHKQEEAARQQQQVLAAPIPQHAQPQATVLLTTHHHQFSSSVSSSDLPPQHTPRSRPASPPAADGSAAAAPHHASSLSVATTVATPSIANSSPRASVRRSSLSPSHSPSQSHSRRKSISGSFPMPSTEVLVAGAAVVTVGAAAAVVATSPSSSAAAPASDAAASAAPSDAAGPAAAVAAPAPFLAESLTSLVLFNRLAGFGSLLVLDLRSAEDYKSGHVPRALNIPMTDEDLLAAEGELAPAACTSALGVLEKRLHMTDQRTFRMRQRCTVVLVGSPFVPAAAVDAAAESSSASSSSSDPLAAAAAAAAAPVPFSLAPHMSSSHHPHCLHLARLLTIESKIAAVSVLDGGYAAFAALYPCTVCSYSAAEAKSGKHIHRKPFPWYPNEILAQGIYLGSKVDAQNLEHLQHLRISHVLNATTEIPNHFEDVLAEGTSTSTPAFVYKRIELHDEVNVSISAHFAEAFQFIDQALASSAGQGRVLVHCQEGISRSSTNLIAYLMARHKLSLHAAYGWVKAQRKQIFPNLGFWRQLDLFERTLMHSALLAEAAARGEDASTVPAVESLKGTMDQCIDLALLTAEYQARVAAKAAAAAEAAASAGSEDSSAAASSSSSSSSDPAEESASERVRRQVLSPVERSNTLRAVRGVASEDAKIRAEEAVVEEAQTPQGPIVTSEG